MTVKYGKHPPVPPGTPCEACGAVSHMPVTDHCHDHGWVRAVLCRSCNGLMGWWDRHAEIRPSLLAVAQQCPGCFPENAPKPVMWPFIAAMILSVVILAGDLFALLMPEDHPRFSADMTVAVVGVLIMAAACYVLVKSSAVVYEIAVSREEEQ